MKTHFLVALLFISMLACSDGTPPYEAADQITEEGIMGHVSVLASDDFMGRATGSEGEWKTVEYLVKEMEAIGADPGVDGKEYVQNFPLVGQKTSNHTLKIGSNKGKYQDDFVSWPADEATKVDIKNAELVYVGYGIQAPEENWDDFKEVDATGKILIIKNNDPEYDDELFGGFARLYYGRYGYKYEKAKEMGALGAIIIHTTETAGYGWNVVSNSWGSERFNVKAEDASSDTKLNAWMTYEMSASVFKEAGLNIDEMLAAADDPDFTPVPLKGVQLSASMDAEYRTINAMNVLGVIEGSDPELKDEYLVLTAHHDHLGITTPVDGDDINNGAEDNAAGVATLLEMMKVYKSQQGKLKRSVLGLIVSAEEVGLLGSQYWAKHPTVDPGKVSANINLDGTNVYGATKDVVLVGYGRNTVGDLVEKHAAEVGRVVKPDPHPDRGYFYRSDHFNMAKVGIPAIFPNSGREFIGKPEGYLAVVDSVADANYHTVNDEVNEYWDLTGAVNDARLFFKVGLDVLNNPELQSWYSGDEFEAVRLQSISN